MSTIFCNQTTDFMNYHEMLQENKKKFKTFSKPVSWNHGYSRCYGVGEGVNQTASIVAITELKVEINDVSVGVRDVSVGVCVTCQ